MGRVLVLGSPFADTAIEQDLLAPVGLEVEIAGAGSQGLDAASREVVGVLLGTGHVTEAVMDGLPGLQVVSRYGVGLDNVDLDAARRRGVAVSYVPDYGVEEVALHSVALMLGSVRRVAAHDRAVREGRWDYRTPGSVERLSERTAGVVGLGRIGSTVARYVAPFFSAVVGHDPLVPPDAWPAGVTPLSLAEVFERSHVVSLHLPLTRDTTGLVDRGLLARMLPGSHLVNTARGGLVDLDALRWALDAVPLGGAALDVLPDEPPQRDHPLLRRPEVTFTPHTAWFSREAEVELRSKAARNITSFLTTGTPLYPVPAGATGAAGDPPREAR